MGECGKMIRMTCIKKCLVYSLVGLLMLISCEASDKYPFSKEEMEVLSREELMSISGRVFYIISDSQIGEYARKAQIFTVENGKYKVYLTIKNEVIKKGDGSVFLNIKKYPIEFDSWKIAKNSTNKVFLIYPCYNKQETADPIFIEYNMSKDILEEKIIDPSEY